MDRPLSGHHLGLSRSRGDHLPRIDSEKTLARNDSDLSSKCSSTKRQGSDDVAQDLGVPVLPASETTKGDLEDGSPTLHSIDSIPELSKARKIILGIVVMFCLFISVSLILTVSADIQSMSSNSVILTIPRMSRDLGVSQLRAQWVASSYTLSYGCSLLISGRLADIFGRRWLFLGGMLIAVIFTFISGAIKIFVPLCIIRAIVGVGLAVATPAAFGIVGVNFRDHKSRTIAYGCMSMGNPVGASVAMIVGGAMASAGGEGWEYLYYVLGGIALIPLVLGFFVIPKDPKPEVPVDKRVDWLGGFLITAALCFFTFSITESGIAKSGWRTPYIVALLVVSIVLLGAFGFWERYIERHTSLPPIVKMSMLSRNGFGLTKVCLTAFLPFIAIAGWIYLVSLYYQDYKNYTPFNSALHSLPASLCGVIAAVAVMWVVPRFRAPHILAVGGILSGAACILYAAEPVGTSYWAMEFIACCCLPFGADMTVAVGSILMSNMSGDDEQSVAGALFQTSVQIGQALGTCVTSLIVSEVQTNTGDLLQGIRAAFYFCSAFPWAIAIFAFFGLRKIGLAKDVGYAGAAH